MEISQAADTVYTAIVDQSIVVAAWYSVGLKQPLLTSVIISGQQ